MVMQSSLHAKENRSLSPGRDAQVDPVFLFLILLLLLLGLAVLYSASFAQSLYDTGYEVSTRYLQKQAVWKLHNRYHKGSGQSLQNTVPQGPAGAEAE